MDEQILRRRLEALAAAEGAVPVPVALALFDELPAVELDEMLGDWDGHCIPTGHPAEEHLAQLAWAGKRVHGRDEVDPLVCWDARGGRVVSAFVGSATLRGVGYRGGLAGGIGFGARPYLEHCRRVSDDVLLGVAERKGEPAPLVFCLRRATPVSTQRAAD